MILNQMKLDCKGSFVVYLAGLKRCYVFEIRDYKAANAVEEIDVSYLSEHLLKDILKLEDLTKSRHIEYLHEIKLDLECFKDIEKNAEGQENMDMMIMCPRIRLSEVQAVADEEHCLPPKSTFMYPKPLIGILFKAFKKFNK